MTPLCYFNSKPQLAILVSEELDNFQDIRSFALTNKTTLNQFKSITKNDFFSIFTPRGETSRICSQIFHLKSRKLKANLCPTDLFFEFGKSYSNIRKNFGHKYTNEVIIASLCYTIASNEITMDEKTDSKIQEFFSTILKNKISISSYIQVSSDVLRISTAYYTNHSKN